MLVVDDLELAQFLYLLTCREKLRNVIDTLTSKVVLLLGRFKPERKAVLDSLREALRIHGYVPVLFDFARPESKDTTEQSFYSHAWRASSLPTSLRSR